MQEVNFDEVIASVLAQSPRYSREAYLFLRDALDHTQRQIARQSKGQVRHVTGGQLLEGIREYALEQFGPMTPMVLEEWGVRECSDFGELVFNMVDAGLLAKQPTDSRADFAAGYSFEEAFRVPFLPPSRLGGRAAMRPADAG